MRLSDVVSEEQATSCIKHVDIITCMSDYRKGCGLEIGFIDHLKSLHHGPRIFGLLSSPVILLWRLLIQEIIQLPAHFVSRWLSTTRTKSSLHKMHSDSVIYNLVSDITSRTDHTLSNIVIVLVLVLWFCYGSGWKI